jgi:hypothetical protein
METRIARLEKRWPKSPPAPSGPKPDYSALTGEEQYDLYNLLDLLGGRECGEPTDRPLTPEEEQRLETLWAKVGEKEA